MSNTNNQQGPANNAVIPPLYLSEKDIFGRIQAANPLTGWEICKAMGHVIQEKDIDGAQLVRGVWRLHTNNQSARIILLAHGVTLRQRHTILKDSDPSIQNDIQSEKINIRHLPMSITNDEIETYLRGKGVKLLTPVKDAYIRDDNGLMTRFRNGDRFAYAEAPIFPVLSANCRIANYEASIYHQSQRDVCKACGNLGHHFGDERCPALIKEGLVAPFRSYQMKLSNMAPVIPSLEYAGMQFKTIEHAYHWRRAEDADQHELAERIRRAPHAGVAKALSRQIDSDPEKWQTERGVEVMSELLWIKYTTDDDAYRTLMDTGDKRIAEATGHPFWACGLDYERALVTNPKYWRGENMMGNLLENLRRRFRQQPTATTMPIEKGSDIDTDNYASAVSDSDTTEVVQYADGSDSDSAAVEARKLSRRKQQKKKNTNQRKMTAWTQSVKRAASHTPPNNKGAKQHAQPMQQIPTVT